MTNRVKKITALSMILTTNDHGNYDLNYVVGAEGVTGIVEQNDGFYVIFKKDDTESVRFFNKRYLVVGEVDLKEFEVPVEPNKEIILPKKTEIIRPSGEVIDLNEIKKNKNKR